MFAVLRPLVLASGSPRRQQFLRDLGLAFRVVLPQGREPRPEPGEQPVDYALRIAALKGESVAAVCPEDVVLAADTIVILNNDILGKPADEREALTMLERLSGCTHVVVTAVSLRIPGAERLVFHCESRVAFHSWPRSVLEAYAKSGEPLDKAGGYAVQGLGSFLVRAVEGSWTSVVGLPVTEVTELLLNEGVIRVESLDS